MGTGKKERNTEQRRVILEELQKLTSHPTATDLYEVVRNRLPKISLGTVYRNLELLAKNNIIQKLDLSGQEARFDGNVSRHYHVRCVRCERVDDLADIPADGSTNHFTSSSGYEILGYRIEFYGVCPKCTEDGAKGMGIRENRVAE
jgi:Fur family ferric uptake transcriptional regulator